MKEKEHGFYCEAASVLKDGFGLSGWTWVGSLAEPQSPYKEDRGEAGSRGSSSRAVLRMTGCTGRGEGKASEPQEGPVCPPYPRSGGLCGKVRADGGRIPTCWVDHWTFCHRNRVPGHRSRGAASRSRPGTLL